MLRYLFRGAGWLVLPLALLLCAQWPLRDAVQAYSREANDLAQILFAVYMAVAVTAASRYRTHLAAHGAPAVPRGWRHWATAACVAPWAAFMLWCAAPQVRQSVVQLERFGETLDPGYFIIKLSLALLLVLVLADALSRARGESRGT